MKTLEEAWQKFKPTMDPDWGDMTDAEHLFKLAYGNGVYEMLGLAPKEFVASEAIQSSIEVHRLEVAELFRQHQARSKTNGMPLA